MKLRSISMPGRVLGDPLIPAFAASICLVAAAALGYGAALLFLLALLAGHTLSGSP